MAIALTADPILTVDDVRTLIDEQDTTVATLLINSVSAQFLAFTGRLRITAPGSDLVELLGGMGGTELWLHAAPIVSVTSVELLADGEVSDTLTSDDYEIYADAGVLHRNGATWPLPTGERDIKVTYKGGWTAGALPGDVIAAALEQMRWERLRLRGEVGVESLSRGGESVTYEKGGLLRAVREAWAPYRIVV